MAAFEVSTEDRELNGVVVIGGAVGALFVCLFAVGKVLGARYRLVEGLVQGAHSLHFSVAGIHHVSPGGDYRYSWRGLQDVSILLEYVVFRFRGQGTLAVPTRALTDFGPAYDEEFLRQLAPLMQAGVGAEE